MFFGLLLCGTYGSAQEAGKSEAQMSVEAKKASVAKERYSSIRAFEDYARKGQMDKAVENGVKGAELYYKENYFQEAFDLLRRIDQQIEGTQQPGSAKAGLHYYTSKVRMQMYMKMRRSESAKEHLNLMESHANASGEENLKNDLIEKLDGMLSRVDYLTARAPEILAEYRENLLEKMRDLLGEAGVDEGRLLQEAAIYADRICIDEELTRLRSHIEAMREVLDLSESVGRKLDFLAQEMGREANTILSKTIDVASTEKAIELKTEVEKVREQIQNIE